MKVLWLCNYPTKDICDHLKIEATVNEGWLLNLSRSLIILQGIEIVFVFPNRSGDCFQSGKCDFATFYMFPNIGRESISSATIEMNFMEILRKENPDVIHIMGTEFPHSLLMISSAEKCDLLDRTIVSIQGMTSFIAKHYLIGIPSQIISRMSLADIVFHTGLKDQKINMEKRGENEKKVISKTKHIMGRTEWDKACTLSINPNIYYHHGGEILRECFYNGKWNLEKMDKHRVFVSQAHYTIKGLHLILAAFKDIVKDYPDAKLYIGGSDIYSGPLWKKGSYAKYIRNFIEKNNLTDKVFFLGKLSAEEMKEQYLKANVYVLGSTIENSPNSLAEAMILGTPIVASYVGGVPDMVNHGKEGYLYPCNEPYMLAYYVKKIFVDRDLAVAMSKCASDRAKKEHDISTIVNEFINIYNLLSK